MTGCGGPDRPTDHRYLLAGVTIRVSCTDPTVAGLIDARLSALRQPPAGGADVHIDFRGPPGDDSWLARPSGESRTIYDVPPAPIEYFDLSDQLFFERDRTIRMVCSPAEGLIRSALMDTASVVSSIATFQLLTVPLMETMKRLGQFPLHAAALSLGGAGVLVPGTSGAGKSTTTVALVRAGFDFLSDDTVFLSRTGTGSISVAGLPEEIDVTERTISMIPELGGLVDQPLRPGREKYSFRVDDIFGVSPVASCHPAAIVFPRVVEGRPASLEPMPVGDALLELMPNLLATEPSSTQAHLDLLGDLVRTVPCFRLTPGSDLAAAAACIADLVG